MRQIVLDTETTGLEPSEGHRIIEIGCVELINRRPSGNTWQQFINPERQIDAAAMEVHGIGNDQLADEPRFEDIAETFIEFVDGAELIIHNAPFDVGFLDHELARLDPRRSTTLAEHCTILDTLVLARSMHPGQRNSLDALCKRYGVDNSSRTLHGALLDARILADVYLAMTGGQAALSLGGEIRSQRAGDTRRRPVDREGLQLIVTYATEQELLAHQNKLSDIQADSAGHCLWREIEPA